MALTNSFFAGAPTPTEITTLDQIRAQAVAARDSALASQTTASASSATAVAAASQATASATSASTILTTVQSTAAATAASAASAQASLTSVLAQDVSTKATTATTAATTATNAASTATTAATNAAASAAAAALFDPALYVRKDGTVSFTVRPSFNGNLAWDAGNFNPALKANLASPAFTGTATFAARPTFAGNTPWDSGNFTASSKADLASPAFTGTATFANRPTFAGNAPWDAGNFNPATKLNLTGGTLTGALTVGGALSVTGDITAYRTATPTTGALYLNQAGTKYLYYDGTNFNLNGGGLTVVGGNYVQVNAASPTLDLLWNGVYLSRQVVDSSGNHIFKDGSNGDNKMYLTTGGRLWLKNINGFLEDYIYNQDYYYGRIYAANITGRQVYAADHGNGTAAGTGMWEPYNGGVITGRETVLFNGAYITGSYRWRFLQMRSIDAGWYTVAWG